MIQVDRFLDRVPGPQYKCFDFVREVWRESFGVDLGDQLKGLAAALDSRKVRPGEVKRFIKLAQPVNPCFVIFQRPRNIPHIGIWYEGRVLHLQGGQSAQYVPLKDVKRLLYTKVSFYTQ
jgi:hypothetical protein